MKLKIAQNRNSCRIFINIGINSQIRLRIPVVEWLGIGKGDYILVGTDEAEGDNPTAIYMVKSDKPDDYRGYKVSNGNGAHHFSGKSLVDHFKLEKPKAYPYEMITDENRKMIKIFL